MGLEMSKVNALIVGDTLDSRYDIYKIIDLYKNKQDNDYFKVNDLLDFNLKKAVEPVLVRDRMAQRLFKLILEINHPNIERYEFFVEDGLFYVVREYNDDYYAFAWRLQIQRHLQSRYKNIEIEEEQIVYWMKQLLQAVYALHQHNVLHRYITPECMSFKKDQLKLFIPATSVILAGPDKVVFENTTWYKCPEHMETKKVGLKYDIWSLGWTLYNLCSLDDGRFVLDDVEDFKNWKVPNIPRFYTRELDRIFKKMVQFNPDDRPTAAELLDDEVFAETPNEEK